MLALFQLLGPYQLLKRNRIIDIYRCLCSSDRKKTVAVAMSGGIDSAVSAYILSQPPYNYSLIGVYMRNWDSTDEFAAKEVCPQDIDRRDMVQICQHLQIPHHEVEFVKEYWNQVFTPFLDAYKSGESTPNPDIMCNRFVKFNAFREYCLTHLGVDSIATGHYVTIDTKNSNQDDNSSNYFPILRRGIDPMKDQSYFLCMTPVSSLILLTIFFLYLFHRLY